MPRQFDYVPRYRRHKRSDQAIVTLNGHDIYLGPYGTKASKLEYDRVITQWMAAGRRHVPNQAQTELSILALCLAYLEFAEGYYVKNGKPTSRLINVKLAIRYIREHYGRTLAVDFGPLALQTMQRILAEKRLTRKTVNSLVGIYKAMFRWANNQEMLPPHVYQALQPVPGLKKGRSPARESQPVLPVERQIVEQTLPHLPQIVADMVRFQLLTAVRPQEVYSLRLCDLDRREKIWRYTPEHHKTEHHGKKRIIYIGPQAQAVLQPYLDRSPEEHCFQPRESESKRNADRRTKRKSPMAPSQRHRQAKLDRKRRPRETVACTVYGRVTTKLCKTFLATYKPAGGIVRVVLVKEEHGWYAFYCTNPDASVPEILEAFADRATIEQDFHDVKEVWGAGQQQVRNIWSNVAAYNLNLWMHTLVELWAWNRPAKELCDRSDSPWDDAARRPSHANRRKALRKLILQQELANITTQECLPQKMILLAKNLLDLAA